MSVGHDCTYWTRHFGQKLCHLWVCQCRSMKPHLLWGDNSLCFHSSVFFWWTWEVPPQLPERQKSQAMRKKQENMRADSGTILQTFLLSLIDIFSVLSANFLVSGSSSSSPSCLKAFVKKWNLSFPCGDNSLRYNGRMIKDIPLFQILHCTTQSVGLWWPYGQHSWCCLWACAHEQTAKHGRILYAQHRHNKLRLSVDSKHWKIHYLRPSDIAYLPIPDKSWLTIMNNHTETECSKSWVLYTLAFSYPMPSCSTDYMYAVFSNFAYGFPSLQWIQ